MSKIPDQAEFNKDHEYPRPYGEDGDIAVGNNYTQTEAFEKFEEYWLDTAGYVPDDMDVKDVVLMWFGWKVHPDYANDDDNMDYALLYDDSKTKPRYTGWVWQA